MRGLAAWIMRGRLTAIAATVICAVVPLLGWASGAVVALVTLRRSAVEGLIVVGGTLLALSGFYSALAGQWLWVVAPALELWLPVLVLAIWLRKTISLSSTLQLALALGAVAVVGFHALVGDPLAYWRPRLDSLSAAFPPGVADTWRAAAEQMLPMLTGLWALGLVFAAVVSLLLGRWLQALLYNPGGFGREFRNLDLGRGLAAVAAALWVGAALGAPAVFHDLAVVVTAVFVLQALSLVHSLVAAQRLGRGWLIVTYLLLPFGFQLMAMAGVADAAFQWRRRLKLGAGS